MDGWGAWARGDVYLVVQVLPYPLFGWEGDNLRQRERGQGSHAG